MSALPDRRGLVQRLLAAYEDERRRGALDVFEWFCLSDPLIHWLDGDAGHLGEREQQAEFVARLQRFFLETLPELAPEEHQARLDALVREHVRKWDGEAVESRKRSKAAKS